MNLDTFYFLGKILKPVGHQGHVMIVLDVDNPDDYRSLEQVYIDLDHEQVPFAVTSVEIRGKKKALIKLSEVDSADHAEAFTGLDLYLPLSTLPPLTGNKFYFHEIIHFHVLDENYGNIGMIEKVLELPNQALLQIRFHQKEILVPVIDEIIRSVDRDQKVLFIKAPEGLIGMYLDS